MSYLDTQPIVKNDTVKVIGINTGCDGAIGVVTYMNNLTAMATVRFKKCYRDIHISKLKLIGREYKQTDLFKDN